MFSALRQGATFYILERKEKPILKVGKVESRTEPVSKFGYNATIGVDTTIDVVVSVGDEKMEYKQLPSTLSVATYTDSDIVVSDSREAMLTEVEDMQRKSQDIIDSIDYHKGVLESCDGIIRVLNPQLAKEKATEDKINSLSNEMVNIKNSLTDLRELLVKTLGHKNE